MRLVLEGGGVRAAFTSGVLHGFAEAGSRFSSVIGSSTGSMVAAFFASRQTEELRRIWLEHIPGNSIISYARLVAPGVRPAVDMDRLVDGIMAREVRLDRRAATAGAPRLFVVGTAVSTGSCVVGEPTAETLLPWIKGSAALPVGYNKVVRVDGHAIIDGGISDPVPFRLALPGVSPEEPTVVVLTRPMATRKPPPSWWQRPLVRLLAPAHARALILGQHDLHNALMRSLEEAREQGRLQVIEPPPGMPLKRLTRDRGRIRAGWTMGYETGLRAAPELRASVGA
jgi:predicted patatin/cPLA2 family phospholipase